MNGKLLQAYWLNRISCSYQQQLAISIRDKLRKQKGYYTFIMGNELTKSCKELVYKENN
jgi:hypothetical protein